MVEQNFPTKKAEEVRNWNPNIGEGEDYIIKVLGEFKEDFGHIPGIHDIAPGNYHGSVWVISYSHPFIFDQRKAPPSDFLGVDIRGGTPINEMPEEFQITDGKKEYVWAYQRYEKFVDRCADQIRKELGDSSMSREEMLDALTPGGNFQAWKSQCKTLEEKNKIPRYQDKFGSHSATR